MRVKREVKSEMKVEVKDEMQIVKTEKITKVVKVSKGKKGSDESSGSPFPEFNRPSYDDCQQVVESLTVLHGVKEEQNSIRPVLDALVRTILSQNTTDKTSMVAFQNLKRVCPTWSEVLAADDSVIEEAIRFGGLAEIKVRTVSFCTNYFIHLIRPISICFNYLILFQCNSIT